MSAQLVVLLLAVLVSIMVILFPFIIIEELKEGEKTDAEIQASRHTRRDTDSR